MGYLVKSPMINPEIWVSTPSTMRTLMVGAMLGSVGFAFVIEALSPW